MMKGLLGDPQRLSMLIGGLGLLGSKYQDQADKWKGYAAQGLISGAQHKQTQAARDADWERGQPLRDLQMQKYQAEIDRLNNPVSTGTFANQAFYAQGPNNAIKAFQLNNKGEPREIPLPEGFVPAIPATALDTGGGFQLIDRFGGMPTQPTSSPTEPAKPTVIDKTLAPSQTPDHQANVIAAKKEAESSVQAKQEFSSNQDQAQETLGLIDEIISHPGRKIATGGSSWLGDALSMVPGTDATDFHAKLEQLGGKQFLAAFESLKGGGQITEIEGLKAEKALNNLKTAQSEEQFLTNLQTLKNVIQSGLDRAKTKAGVSKVRKYNPETGEFE